MEEIRKFRRDRVAAARSRQNAQVIGALTAAAWVAAPWLVWQAMWVGWGYESPTAQEQYQEAIYLVCATVCGLVAPVVAVVLGSVARNRWIIAIAVLEGVLSVAVLFGLLATSR